MSQHILTFITVYQPLGLRDVVLLSSSQDEAQGVAQTIHAHMDLGAEPTAAPSQGLGCLATLLGGATAAQGWARTTVLSMMRYSIYLERFQVLTYFHCNQMSTQPSTLHQCGSSSYNQPI